MNSMPLLHFAHANGFPAGSYNKLFAYLKPQLDIIALDRFGHDERFPVQNNWPQQVKELVHYIESNASEPVYAVGHSFGGVVSYMACCLRPDLFRGLIMLDPPLLGGWFARAFAFAKKTPLIDKLTPAGKSKIRKTFWEQDDDLVAYFRSRGLFKDMDLDCVKDYVAAVTTEHDNGRKLRFDHQIETKLFRSIPDNLRKYYGMLQVPAKLITAEHTDICHPPIIRPFLANNNVKHEVFSGVGHMFPLEQPQKVAEMIQQQILSWDSKVNRAEDVDCDALDSRATSA